MLGSGVRTSDTVKAFLVPELIQDDQSSMGTSKQVIAQHLQDSAFSTKVSLS